MVAEKLLVPFFRRATRSLSVLKEGNLVVTPHPVPDLPILNELEHQARRFITQTKIKPEETAIVGAQHFLETTSSLFRSLRNLGFEIYATGKCYSTNPNVYATIKQLGVHAWPGSKPERLGEYKAACEKDIALVLEAVEQNSKIKRIIFCDDGGRFFEKMPNYFRKNYHIAGLEQTRGGYYSRNVEISRIPIVNIAQSAAKVLFEPSFIADASGEAASITSQLNRKSVIGIIGFGSIGQSLTNKFIKDGFQVAIFDTDAETYKNYPHLDEIEIMPSIEHLFRHTNFIIGCTGQDTTKSFDLFSLHDDRILASVSSEDKEFNRFLKDIAADSTRVQLDPLSNIKCYTNHGNVIEILYGGFPINFVSSSIIPYNVPAHRIAMTQGLLFSGIMQAIELTENNKTFGLSLIPNNVMLHPQLQQKVIELWYNTTFQENSVVPQELLTKFLESKEWVAENSKGTHFPSKIYEIMFEPPKPKYNFSLHTAK